MIEILIKYTSGKKIDLKLTEILGESKRKMIEVITQLKKLIYIYTYISLSLSLSLSIYIYIYIYIVIMSLS